MQWNQVRRVLVVLALAVLAGSASGQGLWWMNTDSNGDEADAYSWYPTLSEDGRYAIFGSQATNLVSGVSGFQVYVKDRLTGQTTVVSVDSSGAPGVGGVGQVFPSGISRDGRIAAFSSDHFNLVPGANAGPDIYVHDRSTGVTSLVSVDSSGQPANRASRTAKLTDDGRYVLFSSAATNLVPNDNNNLQDLFLHDRQTGTTTRVNLDSAGNEATGGDTRWGGWFAPQAMVVVFESEATNLVAGDTKGHRDIFARDLVTGITTRVSVRSNGAEANNVSYGACVSDNGNAVLFTSAATNLVPNDTNNVEDVFLHKRLSGKTKRISVTASGDQGDGRSRMQSWSHCLTGDGGYACFDSAATNLVTPDLTGAGDDIFVKDIKTGAIRIVSRNAAGDQADNWSFAGAISRDGRHQIFESAATNLSPKPNTENGLYAVGPYLTLESDPESVPPGASFTLTTWTGQAGSRAFLAATAVNGQPLFLPLLRGNLDGQGLWTVPGNNSPGLSGNAVTLVSFGFAPTSEIEVTNQETVTFQ